MVRPVSAALVSLLLVAACGGGSSAPDADASIEDVRDALVEDAAEVDAAPTAWRITAGPWPEADELFHQEPRWLGGDAAYSVPLGGDRTLWLFGDSFIATSDAFVRTESVMVRNSVAVQIGLDPATAAIEFSWHEAAAGGPSSWLPEAGEEWFWPLHGIRLGGSLTLFFLRETAVSGGLGFEAVGSAAFRVSSPDEPSGAWVLEPLGLPPTTFPVAIGTSVLAADRNVYAYAVEEPGDHDVYLLRWDETDFAAGRLDAPEWWDGAAGWLPHAALTGPPAAVFRDAQTELTVSSGVLPDRLVEVQSRGFGDTTIAVRLSPAVEGPFTAMRDAFHPPESTFPGVFVYAGKAHPELLGADLVVTYAANASDFARLLSDTSLYYPRFVRLTFTPE